MWIWKEGVSRQNKQQVQRPWGSYHLGHRKASAAEWDAGNKGERQAGPGDRGLSTMVCTLDFILMQWEAIVGIRAGK